MPSTCSSRAVTLLLLYPRFVSIGSFDVDDFASYYEVSRAVQYLQEALHGTVGVAKRRQQ